MRRFFAAAGDGFGLSRPRRRDAVPAIAVTEGKARGTRRRAEPQSPTRRTTEVSHDCIHRAFPRRASRWRSSPPASSPCPRPPRPPPPAQAGRQGRGRRRRRRPRRPSAEMIIPDAYPEQVKAAEMVYYGKYDCEFNQTVDIAQSPKHSAYVTVKHGKGEWLMKPVLSSTGAIRLEDVKGETLMVQIASKSMLLNTKTARAHRRRVHQPEAARADRSRQGGQGGVRQRPRAARSGPAALASARALLRRRRRLDNGAPCRARSTSARAPPPSPSPFCARPPSEMLDWNGTGVSVMEVSHRGKEFMAICRPASRPTCASCSRFPRTTRCCSCRAARSARTRSCR